MILFPGDSVLITDGAYANLCGVVVGYNLGFYKIRINAPTLVEVLVPPLSLNCPDNDESMVDSSDFSRFDFGQLECSFQLRTWARNTIKSVPLSTNLNRYNQELETFINAKVGTFRSIIKDVFNNCFVLYTEGASRPLFKALHLLSREVPRNTR
jgi:hypothetical protein